jgi:hypothetical protein
VNWAGLRCRYVIDGDARGDMYGHAHGRRGGGGGCGAGVSEGGAMGREMSRGVRQLHTQIRWADAEARERAMP